MKRWGLGIYDGLRRKHIKTYLNEFVFRFNRRFYRHSRSRPSSASRPDMRRPAIGAASAAQIPGRASWRCATSLRRRKTAKGTKLDQPPRPREVRRLAPLAASPAVTLPLGAAPGP
jgi:hypothetical protein